MFEKILEDIARRHGVSVREVYQNMEACMKLGQQSRDPAVQAKWALVPCKGESPTVEEMLRHLSDEARRKIKG